MTSAPDPDWHGAIARARTNAPFLARALDRQPELEALLGDGAAGEALDWAGARGEQAEVGAGLRQHRLALATSLAIADLAGAFDLARVMAELTSFADHALDTAIRTAIGERTGEPRTDGFFGLALGKQGAGELNYSSDIDPILLYEPERLPCLEKDDPGQAAQRYARRIVRLLSEQTREGYVLRVDLRLRPASEISPLAVPRAAALSHYQSDALAWERAAFIRARAAAGDVAAGEAFLDDVAPFVWRQALDFGAIGEIRALTHRIRDNSGGPARPGPGFDIKRGRGGIREIEFFAQTHQLIHGGRDPSLRERGTRAALDALAETGRIESGDAAILGEAYDRLRTVEHRLQMMNDRQTHSLPEGDALDAVARLDGMADGAALVKELDHLTGRTAAIYQRMIDDAPGGGVGAEFRTATATTEPPPPPPLSPVADQLPPSERGQLLARLGYDDPETLAARIEGWRDGRYASLRSPQAIDAFDRFLPEFMQALGESDDPRRALIRWERVLEQASSIVSLLRLCVARPAVLARLVATLTLAPTLADELGVQPERLDVLVDLQPSDPLPDRAATAARMTSGAQRSDVEARLDAIRRVTGEERFALGVRLIEGTHPPRAIARALSEVAEAAIAQAFAIAREEFARTHGMIAGSELTVLGLGRLGGGALTHASDLDLVYLFTGDFTAQSDGKRPLGATLYFNRLASRVGAALSVPTAKGSLYEVDTRLRPQGRQGPLAVSLDSFANYQAQQAWTWEHMALARGRVLIGSDSARSRIEQEIERVLWRPRDPDRLRADVLAMRADMALHKPPRGPLDVKLARGGLVDVEFLVQYLQLREGATLAVNERASLDPDLAISLAALERRGLVAEGLLERYDLLTAVLVAGRLLAADTERPPPAAASALARACGYRHYDGLMSAISQARGGVAVQWHETFGQELESE